MRLWFKLNGQFPRAGGYLDQDWYMMDMLDRVAAMVKIQTDQRKTREHNLGARE